MSIEAEVPQAPLPLYIALGFRDGEFLDRLAEVAAIGTDRLSRDLEAAVTKAIVFRSCRLRIAARDRSGARPRRDAP
jgi:hypothetical protein